MNASGVGRMKGYCDCRNVGNHGKATPDGHGKSISAAIARLAKQRDKKGNKMQVGAGLQEVVRALAADLHAHQPTIPHHSNQWKWNTRFVAHSVAPQAVATHAFVLCSMDSILVLDCVYL